MFHPKILKNGLPKKPGKVSNTESCWIHPKFNIALKNGGWKTILSYWEGNFSGAMLNFGRVIKCDC